jgi:hypothetical protein
MKDLPSKGVAEAGITGHENLSGRESSDFVSRWMLLMSKWELAYRAYETCVAASESLGPRASDNDELQATRTRVLAELQDIKNQIDLVIGSAAARRSPPLTDFVMGYLDLTDKAVGTPSGRVPFVRSAH